MYNAAYKTTICTIFVPLLLFIPLCTGRDYYLLDTMQRIKFVIAHTFATFTQPNKMIKVKNKFKTVTYF